LDGTGNITPKREYQPGNGNNNRRPTQGYTRLINTLCSERAEQSSSFLHNPQRSDSTSGSRRGAGISPTIGDLPGFRENLKEERPFVYPIFRVSERESRSNLAQKGIPNVTLLSKEASLSLIFPLLITGLSPELPLRAREQECTPWEVHLRACWEVGIPRVV